MAGEEPTLTRPERLGRYTVVGALDDAPDVVLGIADGEERVVELRPLRAGESLQQARYLPALKHHGLCQVVAVEDQLAVPRIAREHLGGATLKAVLHQLRQRGEPLGGEAAMGIGHALLEALDFLHRQPDPLTRAPLGLGHGALSQRTIVLTWDGELKLRDFGLNKASTADDLAGAAALLAGLFAAPPRPLLQASADAASFVSCGALAEALSQAEGRGSAHSGRSHKVLRELMAALYPGAAAGDAERRRALLARRHKASDERAAALVEPRRPSGPRSVEGQPKHEQAAPQEATPSSGRPLMKKAALGIGGVVGLIAFGVWSFTVVQWFQDAGMLPTTGDGRLLDDGPGLGGRVLQSPGAPPTSGKGRVRRSTSGPLSESVMGTRAGAGSSGEVKGVLEGCSQPCAGPVLKAVLSGGRVQQRDDEVELTSSQLETCLALCRDRGSTR